MKAVVLAAGMGERFWPLTENRPKHLLPVAGVSIIERTLSSLSKAGIGDVVLVTNYQAEKIKDTIGNGQRVGCRVTYVRQKNIRGTADALGASRAEMLGEDRFLTVYGDDFYQEGLLSAFVRRIAGAKGMVIATSKVTDVSKFGRLTVKRGIVHSIEEKSGKGPGHVNAGIYVLDESIFAAIASTKRSVRGEFELTDSLEALRRSGQRVQTVSLEEGKWVGLSYPWDLLEANRLATDEGRPYVDGEVENGVDLRGPVTIEKGSIVKSGSYVEGPVFLGSGSMVGPNSYLRPHTALGRNVRIGAGCEVKNSIVMDNTLIPHLSYVGDSIIGESCSLGAGTITANLRFDDATVKSRVKKVLVDSGKRKLGAVLGDNVRTGINVSLLPGVKIGRGAWIGPGVTVVEDVPSMSRLKG